MEDEINVTLPHCVAIAPPSSAAKQLVMEDELTVTICATESE